MPGMGVKQTKAFFIENSYYINMNYINKPKTMSHNKRQHDTNKIVKKGGMVSYIGLGGYGT